VRASNSPRKLTILELVLKDHTGQIRLSFLPVIATTVAAGRNSKSADTQLQWLQSGLVKESKYGLTLEDPELEVLAPRRYD